MFSKNHIRILLLLLFLANKSSAQNLYIGIQSGIENTFRDEYIGNHPNYSLFVASPIGENWDLKFAAEFFQNKYYGSPWSYQYRGTTYTVRDGRLWQSYSINMTLRRSLFKKIYMGAGVSANLIKFKEVEHNPYWPILFLGDDQVKPNEIKNEQQNYLKPGLMYVFGWERNILNRLVFIVEMRYALIFGGKDFGYGSLNTLEAISIWGGFKFGL